MPEYRYKGQQTQTFQKLPGYKKIIAWQSASDLSFLVAQHANRFRPNYYALADQMRRAATSVSANIAEGYCGGSLPNYIRYCNLARGSLGELGSYIQDCERDSLIRGEDLSTLLEQYSHTTFVLDRLIQSLIQKREDGDWDNSHRIKEERAEYPALPE
jgi:four helix bundle protein